MVGRVWLLCCAALVGACGGHGEFRFGDRDAGGAPPTGTPDAGVVGAGTLPEPTPVASGAQACASGGRYTVCGGVTGAGGQTLSGGETVNAQVAGSHSISGTRFGIQGGLHVVR